MRWGKHPHGGWLHIAHTRTQNIINTIIIITIIIIIIINKYQYTGQRAAACQQRSSSWSDLSNTRSGSNLWSHSFYQCRGTAWLGFDAAGCVAVFLKDSL
jgi:hypothetical protein